MSDAIRKAIERACRDLPEGFEINISLERHSGTVYLLPPDTDATISMDVDADDRLAAEINEAVDGAIRMSTEKERS